MYSTQGGVEYIGPCPAAGDPLDRTFGRNVGQVGIPPRPTVLNRAGSTQRGEMNTSRTTGRLAFLIGLMLVTVIETVAAAGQTRVEFSADAYQMQPASPPRVSRMFVGDGRTRMEFEANGQPAVEISVPEQGLFVLLLPQQRQYLERPAPPSPEQANTLDPETGPCGRLPDAVCTSLGSEAVNGRDAEKWEMVVNQAGREYRMLYWLDRERSLPLKVFAPDGTVTELTLVGLETLGDRPVEKWLTRVTRPDGQATEAWQWFDPELQIAIREALPGGVVRELRNIQLGPQADTLFAVPSGYTRLTNPSAPATPRIQ